MFVLSPIFGSLVVAIDRRFRVRNVTKKIILRSYHAIEVYY